MVAHPHDRDRPRLWQRESIDQLALEECPGFGIILRRRGLEVTIVDCVTSVETVRENEVRFLVLHISFERRACETKLVKRGALLCRGRRRRAIHRQAKNPPHIKTNEKDVAIYIRLSAGTRTPEKG